MLAADESYGPLAAVRALDAAGYRVWVALPDRRAYAGRSRAAAGVIEVVAPGADPPRYAAELAAAAARLGASVVLPGTEAALRVISAERGRFSEATRRAAPPSELVAKATDKRLLGELSRTAGLDHPVTIELDPGGAEPENPPRIPALVKPTRTVQDGPGQTFHYRGARLVRTREELREAVAEAGRRVLVQEHVAGALAAVCGVAWEGELVCALHQRSTRIWPPDVGVSSFVETVAPDPDREAAVARLLAMIGWSGIFGLQFIEGERSYVIDFNPRLYGTLALAISAGLNLPAIWLRLVLGQPRAASGYRVGARMRVEEADLRAIFASLGRGDGGVALRGALPRRRTAHAVFSLRDPAPSLVSLAKLAGRRPSARGAR